ncbi:unnamed protein product, partial [marine sediment metagenome]
MAKIKWHITPNTLRFLSNRTGSVKKLAKLIGISKTSLYEYARGRPIINKEIAQSIENLLKLYDFSELYPYKGIYEDDK